MRDAEGPCNVLSFGFPPIATPAARVLILGSLPGRRSLGRGEYYAHPRNTFWKIMAAHVGSIPDDYAGRVRLLALHRVALWDVLAAATRSGSLDADIEDDAIPNNFAAFFHAHPKILRVCFNGAMAAKLYSRHALPRLDECQRALERHTLPSTSPAHAGISLADKIERWGIVWAKVCP